MNKKNELTASQCAAAENPEEGNTLYDARFGESVSMYQRFLPKGRYKHPDRLLVVFSDSTGGALLDQEENLVSFRPGMDFDPSWIRDFQQIVLVYEEGFMEFFWLINLLHKIEKNKEFFRDKLFLLIPRGRQAIGLRSEYEIRENEFIPIDIDELAQLPKLPESSVDPAALPLTPYAPDYYPHFTDLKSWITALLKNILTELSRDRLYPQLRNGLLETQRRMLRNKMHIGGLSVVFESNSSGVALDVFCAQKGLFRRCIVPEKDAFRTPRRRADNWASRFYFPSYIKYWFVDNLINELGRDLMPHPDSKRPTIIPREEWKAKHWKFHLDERRPLFPLLLWEGHCARALSLECFIPPYNFHELIMAMKDVLAGLPPPELFPDIEGEKWVDVSDFRDGLGTVTLDAPCRNYRFEPGDRTFRVELSSPSDLDKLLWNIERPCGIDRMKEDKKNIIRIQPDSEEAKEYVAGVLDKAVKPQVMQVRQILWDGNRYRQFATSELMRYYANSIAESFYGNRECATRYLDMLNWKYAGQFPRHTRIIRHR